MRAGEGVDETGGIRVYNEWTEDLSLSLDPDRESHGKILRKAARKPATSDRSSATGLWMGLGLVAGMGLAMVVFGAVGVLLIAGAAMGGAFVLFVPAVDVVLPEPPPAQAVTVEVAAPAPLPEEAPAQAEPVAPPVQATVPRKVRPPVIAPPAEQPVPEVEADLVVMPDPGFRGKPLDESIGKLKDKGDKGKIGVVAGH